MKSNIIHRLIFAIVIICLLGVETLYSQNQQQGGNAYYRAVTLWKLMNVKEVKEICEKIKSNKTLTTLTPEQEAAKKVTEAMNFSTVIPINLAQANSIKNKLSQAIVAAQTAGNTAVQTILEARKNTLDIAITAAENANNSVAQIALSTALRSLNTEIGSFITAYPSTNNNEVQKNLKDALESIENLLSYTAHSPSENRNILTLIGIEQSLSGIKKYQLKTSIKAKDTTSSDRYDTIDITSQDKTLLANLIYFYIHPFSDFSQTDFTLLKGDNLLKTTSTESIMGLLKQLDTNYNKVDTTKVKSIKDEATRAIQQLSVSVNANSATAAGAGGVTLPTEARIIVALADLFIDRFKQELALTFFHKFKTDLDSELVLKTLFPKTHKLLTAITENPLTLPTLGQTWRASFDDDLSNLAYNMGNAFIENSQLMTDVTEYSDAMRLIVRGVQLYDDISNGKHPATILEGFAKKAHESARERGKFINKLVADNGSLNGTHFVKFAGNKFNAIKKDADKIISTLPFLYIQNIELLSNYKKVIESKNNFNEILRITSSQLEPSRTPKLFQHFKDLFTSLQGIDTTKPELLKTFVSRWVGMYTKDIVQSSDILSCSTNVEIEKRTLDTLKTKIVGIISGGDRQLAQIQSAISSVSNTITISSSILTLLRDYPPQTTDSLNNIPNSIDKLNQSLNVLQGLLTNLLTDTQTNTVLVMRNISTLNATDLNSISKLQTKSNPTNNENALSVILSKLDGSGELHRSAFIQLLLHSGAIRRIALGADNVYTPLQRSVLLLNHVSQNFRDIDSKGWVSSDKLRILEDKDAFGAFLRILYEKDTMPFLQICVDYRGLGVLKDQIHNEFDDFVSYATAIDEKIQEIKKKQGETDKEKKPTPEDYASYVQIVFNFFKFGYHLTKLEMGQSFYDNSTYARYVVPIGESLIKAIRFGKEGNYGGVVTNAITMFSHLQELRKADTLSLLQTGDNSVKSILNSRSGNVVNVKTGLKNIGSGIPGLEIDSLVVLLNTNRLTEKELHEKIMEKSPILNNLLSSDTNKKKIVEYLMKAYQINTVSLIDAPILNKYLRYAAFMVDVLNAKDVEETKRALEGAALQAGSYSIKRKAKFSAMLNGYAGLSFGMEHIKNPEGGFSAPATHFGVHAPFGIEGAVSIGNTSIGLLASILNLGSVVNYRIANDSISTLSNLGFAQIFSPGLYLTFGFKDSPFAFGFGAEYNPRLREKFATAIEKTARDVDILKVSLFLGVDLPLYQLYSTTNND